MSFPQLTQRILLLYLKSMLALADVDGKDGIDGNDVSDVELSSSSRSKDDDVLFESFES